jgi:hypothetical protein
MRKTQWCPWTGPRPAGHGGAHTHPHQPRSCVAPGANHLPRPHRGGRWPRPRLTPGPRRLPAPQHLLAMCVWLECGTAQRIGGGLGRRARHTKQCGNRIKAIEGRAAAEPTPPACVGRTCSQRLRQLMYGVQRQPGPRGPHITSEASRQQGLHGAQRGCTARRGAGCGRHSERGHPLLRVLRRDAAAAA